MVKPDEQDADSGTADPASNPFRVLGLPERFDLSRELIESAWMRAAAKAHPDRVGDGAAGSLRTIAEVNASHAVLTEPERRAEALLVLKGGAARDQDKSLPDGFLMEIFQTRQALEEAVASGETSRIEEFDRWAQEQREGYLETVGRAFAELGEPAESSRLESIRRTLNAWRYIERMIEQVRD